MSRQLADYQIEQAESLLQSLSEAGASRGQIAAARQRIEQAARRFDQLNSTINADRDPARLSQMLSEAALAMNQGKLFAPPGESAFDLYSRVLSIDPQNPAAQAGKDRLADEAKKRFEQEIAASRMNAARGYIEGLESYRGDDPALPVLKRRLAGVYLGDAKQSLERNELDRARKSLNHARVLDPDNPEVVVVRARLDRAGGGE